jgi:hypothetical protein
MIQTELKKVYRVFDPSGKEGLWYTSDKIQTNKIKRILPENDMPMDRSAVYSLNDKIWRSSACSFEQLKYWFSFDELSKLISNGFILGEFLVTEWMDLLHGEVIFSEGSLKRVIDIDSLKEIKI